jgi:DNA ligase (NAD+)
VAKSIYEFFHNEDNIALLNRLKSFGLQMEGKMHEKTEGGLTGQTFLFTGTLSKMKRSEAEQKVEDHGGEILGGVSSKLNFLVAGEDAGSKLEKAKKIPSIKILTEEEFLNMLAN